MTFSWYSGNNLNSYELLDAQIFFPAQILKYPDPSNNSTAFTDRAQKRKGLLWGQPFVGG